jgi:hypothetical protein
MHNRKAGAKGRGLRVQWVFFDAAKLREYAYDEERIIPEISWTEPSRITKGTVKPFKA